MDVDRKITAARPIELRTRKFPTQTAAIDYFHAMLSRYSPGDRVSDVDAADLEGLLDIFPFRGEVVWMGREIAHFEVMCSDFDRTCFCVRLDDGSRQRFSYIRCIVPVRTMRRAKSK